ncbi:Nonribosomal peptide synthetase 2 [Colletotrichum sidae]|uniref:Nonribosomal peptide synthetase 2 n=1 Tax=Colletotrichum sidae TaxID=1347389 RepID=A0A4V3I3M9_9PEZI|nr:Nonribosomal peptide synthetase 2 [Colletotrichum sidae]
MLAETSVNSRAYCNWIRLQFPANSSAHDVRKWIFEVANANQILRSAFVPFAHGYAQVVLKRLAERHVQIVKEFAYDFAMISDEDYSSPFRVQVQDNPGNDGTLALLQTHHALYDGWTADLLLEDLSTLAAGHFLEERPQFYEVADFFHGPAVTLQMDEARSFWADQLLGWQRHGLPRLMGRLPDKVEIQTAAKTMNISQADLDDVAKSFQCHAQVFFQAAILWLWAGLQGQTDVVIGSVSSGRTIPVTNIERIMGPCISTTPLRVNLKELTSISDLVRFIHSTNRRVLQHGILPLGEVKKLSGLGPGDAMFDILFVYQESLYSNAARHGKVREVAHRDFLETNILVEIEPTANGPHCCLTYHTNALSDAHANLILDQLESVVRYLLDNPGNPIDAIQAELTPDLTSTFNANPRELATTPDLAAIFEQTTERTPDAVAICFATSPENDEYDTMSYHDLNSMANQIACYLRNQGARQGGIIGLIMEKSLPLYAAMLGILKAGCAYLPLLPSVPKERIHSILLQADVGLCVADAEVSLKLSNLPSCRFVDVRSHSVNLLAMPSANISLPPDPSRPAYVIYTSGTTGTPKGVVVTQLNIAGNLDVLSRIYPISHHSRFLQACSQAFDVSVFEIFFTWKVGACLCSGTNDTLFEDLERAIRKLACTHLSMTPTVASLVDPRNVPNVEFLVTAGEPMTAVVAKNWTGLLFQGYGPAETTNICTVKKMKPGDAIGHLGFSFENTSTFVLAPERSEALPVGFVGELCFGGDQVAAGYLGMQGLTDSKFINHSQFGRIYRSGDMGRMLPDGSLMVLGRMDDQLKLRGQRIDTGEISSTLTTSGLATSSEAVIVNRENSPATHLAVFYVPANITRAEYSTLLIDENLSEANNLLMGQLRAKLPTYMVPTYLIPITSVPLTASGKIDRSRLKSSFRALDQDYLNLAAGSSSQHNDEHVWSEQEKEVASALSQVLAVPPEAISRWQPFAAVGLDSISAISLARSLRNTFARRIPVSLILESGSVARLAQQVASQSPDPDSTRSASTVSFFAKEFVDNLRKEFASKGKVVSAVLPCTPLQEAMVSSTAGSSYCNQLLFKLRVPSTEMRAYWEEMSRRHEVEALALGSSLPAPVDYLPVLREMINPQDGMDAFWRRSFEGFRPISHKLVAKGVMGKVSEKPVVMAEPLKLSLGQLQSVCKASGVSTLSFFQATWTVFLSLLYEETDVCFGNVMSGRSLDHEGIDRLVAPCFNTVPVRVEMASSTQAVTLLKTLQGLNPHLLHHQFTPLRHVQAQVAKRGIQLFDSLLLVQQPRTERSSRVWDLLDDNGIMDIPLVCEIIPDTRADTVLFKLHSNSEYMTPDALAGLLQLVLQLAVDIAQFPASTIPSRASLSAGLAQSLSGVVVERHADAGERASHDVSVVEQEIWTALEDQIRQIVAKLAKTSVHKIGRDTTIFQLGLDSINAVQLAAMMRDEGLQLSALEVLEFLTCAEMAGHLSRSSGTGSVANYDFAQFERDVRGTTRVGDAEKILPCTPLQCAMLNDFIQSKGKDYLNYVSFDIDEGITMAQLQTAWISLVSHHEILRTGFLPTQHQDASFAMLQHPFANLAVPLTIHDDILNPFNVFKWKLDAAQHVLQSLHLPPWTLALERSGSVIRMHFVVHHALYDAHSLQLLLRDLSTYLVESREPTRRGSVELALSKLLLASVDNHESRQFWTDKSSEVVVNRFPTMTPLSEKSPGLVSTSKPSANHLDDLSKSAKDAGFSIQVYLEAAWTRVLSSYIGEDDVVFGVVLSGRLDKDTKDAPFPCINTVPVVAHNRSSNSELLEQIFNNHKQLLKHQHAPLAQVQGWLGYPNTPLFDTLLVYQRFPDNEGVDFPWKPVSDEGNLDYPVSLELEPLKDGHLQLRLTHRTDVLPTAQAGHLLDQFDAVLRQLWQSPTGKEDELWLENASKFSITSPLEPNIASEEHFLHQLVETKARTHPAKTALEFVTGFNGETPISRKWTFKELNDKGNQVANLLHPLAKVGHVIAIHFDKCPEACFSILGILKSGCAFLALDPSAPKARKEFIMKDSGALVLLTNDTIDFDIDQPVIHIDEPSLNGNPKQYTTPEALNVQHNSYCLYTSGTTGTPKGCEITHENAVQAMKAFQRLFAGHWDHTSKWLQFASFHFDVSVLEQYWTWSVGMTLVGAPRDLILDDLAGAIRRLEITHIDLTPSLARLLDPAEVPSLSRGVFITGGEALKQEILDVWGPVGVIYNAYGPTEATIGVTMYQRVPHNGRASNIGKQFDNVGSYVLRPGTDIPVLRGGVGELCVSGKLVGKGYLNRPELTEERFPYLKSFGERVYRTGDLVRLLHDGCFDFLGRADDQVKLRGQRLELGEINHAIRTRVPEITDVATLVTKHGSLDKDLLVSFISCKSTVTSTAALKVLYDTETAVLARAVQKACRDTLPGYMVPSYVFQVPRIPLSPNNKADFKQLNQLFRTLTPERLVQLSPSTRTTSEPSTEIQRRTLSAVQEFVGADTVVSLSSNIFDLGMDSISALRLSRLMRKNGLLGAAPRVVLRNPVLADLAEALQQSQSLEEGTGAYEARQLIQAFGHRYRSLATQELSLPNDREIEYVAPCTPLQEGMLSRFMSDQDEGAYFTAFRLKLSPSVSIDKLKAACERLVQCHPILRTRFIQTPAGFAQIALRSGQLSWKDLRTTSSSDVEAELSRSLPCLIHRNNKCISDPLELIVAQLEGETILVVHIFHALYDGTSFETMLRWVSREYLQQEHEAAPSFLDTLAHGPLANYDTSRQFWAEHLRHCSFDTIQRLPDGDHATVLTRTKTYSARNLETLRRSLNVTLQSVVLALWTSVFKKHFPINAATGVIVSGRSLDIDQIENTIGPLFNTLLFYAGIKDGDTWLSLIQKCHEFNTAVLQFQHVPLRNIQKWCARSRGRPIFENLFVFQVDSAKVTEPTTMWSIMDDYSVSDYPLAFEASVTSDGQLRVQIVAHGDVADEATMDSLFEDIDEAMVDVTSRGTHSLPVTENPSREASAAASPRTPLSSRPESVDGDIKDQQLDLNRSSFQWTPVALSIRSEIAALSGAAEESITEDLALLQLGLDSIDLVKLSARLKHAGHELTLSQLMRSQTIAAMSELLGHDRHPENELGHESDYMILKDKLKKAVESVGVDLSNVEAILPTTPLQESMVADMLRSDFDQYFNHDVLELSDGVDFGRYERAWQRVVTASPILRTVFVQIEDPTLEQTYAQVVLQQSNLSINQLYAGDVSGTRDVIIKHQEAARNAHGLSNLLQLSLIVGEGKTLLILSISHALYDGWSLALLHQDVSAAYHSKLVSRPSVEPFLRHLVKTPTGRSRSFWAQYLANVQPSLLEETRSTSSSREKTHRTEAVSSASPAEATDFCKRHAVSLQVLGQACWAAVLSTLLKTLEVTFGVVLAGRDSEEAQHLMFPTMNTVAVRCFLHGSATDFLQYLQETMGDIVEFQNYPLRKAQAMSGGRLFNTLFILQKSPESRPDNLLATSVDGSAATEFAICAELESTQNNLVWRIAAQNGFVSDKETYELLHQLDRALRYFISSPSGNLLHFEGRDVSICQLPPFEAVRWDEPRQSSSVEAAETDRDNQWTNIEAAIRRVLSQTAAVEPDSIKKSHTLYNLGLDSISAIKVSALLRKEGVSLGVRALLMSSSIPEMAHHAQAGAAIAAVKGPTATSSSFLCDLPETIDKAAILRKAGLVTSQVEEMLPPLPMQVYMITAWQSAEGGVFYPDFFYRLKGSTACSEAGVGLPALFFAAVAKALQTTRISNTSASTGQVVFGIYYANRSLSADLESTFPTLNLIPLRVRVEEGDSVISMARHVQQDLHLISSYSTAGLWELRRWTGVELDCFVNFLHLGDASGETLATSSLHLESISNGAEIEEAKEAFVSAVKPAFCSPRWLEDNAVRGAFSNALDIEASVNGRGLDIGVFGSASRISQDDAEKLIDQLGASLLAV